jgi:hypothetical protein
VSVAGVGALSGPEEFRNEVRRDSGPVVGDLDADVGVLAAGTQAGPGAGVAQGVVEEGTDRPFEEDLRDADGQPLGLGGDMDLYRPGWRQLRDQPDQRGPDVGSAARGAGAVAGVVEEGVADGVHGARGILDGGAGGP